MDRKKRNFLSAMIVAAVAAPLGIFARVISAQQEGPAKRGWPQRADGSVAPDNPDLPKIDPKKIQQHNQKVIQENVEKLYKLAGELKEEVEKTDSTSTLSLSLVQKAKDVEKLAKQIATLAVG
jgi:hypothetical protein